MAYSFTENRAGMLQIANTDSGVTMANGSSAIPTPPNTLGQVVRAFDPTYGEGEFIMLKGVASTVIGSLVVYDPTTYVTTLCPSTSGQARPVAVSMSANTAATTFGWYQISGSTVVSKPTNKYLNAMGPVGISSSAGKVVGTVSAGAGKEILSTRIVTTAATAASTAVIIMDRPHMQGKIT